MSIDLTAYKVAFQELSSSTKYDGLIQAIQDALNHLGDVAYGAFAPGQIFDAAKLKPAGANNGDVLMWGGTQWAPTAPPNSVYVLINDFTLGVDGTFSFPAIPNTFKHLQLVCYLRTDRANQEDDLGVQFNGDTATNYDGYTVKMAGTGPALTGNEQVGQDSARLVKAVTGDSAGANLFAAVTITIPNYQDTSSQRSFHATAAVKVGTSTGDLHVLNCLGTWRTAAAVTRIDLVPKGGGTNFKAGSRASLYGL